MHTTHTLFIAKTKHNGKCNSKRYGRLPVRPRPINAGHLWL